MKKIGAFLLPFLLFSQAALGSSKYGPTSGGGGAVNQVHAGTNVTVTGTTADPIVNATGGVSSVASAGGCAAVTGSSTVTVTSTGCLASASNLSDLASASTARTNLGLGTAATQNLAAFLQPTNNLSEIASASSARTNLGLGTLATQSGTFSGTSSGTNTGDQTITLTGNVTGSGTGSFATTIASSAVTLAMQANLADQRVLGNGSGGSAAPAALAISAANGLVATAGALNWVLAAGQAGGTSMTCGTASGNGCTFSTTSNATKGLFTIGSSTGLSYNESTGWLGIGTATTNLRSDPAGTAGITMLGAGTSPADIEMKPGTATVNTLIGGFSFLDGTSGQVANIQGFSGADVASGTIKFTQNNGGFNAVHLTSTGDGQWQTYNHKFSSWTDSTSPIVQSGGRVFEIATKPPSLASGASITLDAVRVDPITTTLTGTTPVTTAAGFNLVDIEAGTITDASAVNVTNAATLTVKAAPIASGSVTITNGYAVWVQGGASRFDGGLDFRGAATANGTGTIALTNVAPAGAGTTCSEFFAVKGTGGATRYICGL